MPDGQPQSGLVWCDYDGECARVNTTRERQKGKNLLANPRVSMLIVDPEDRGRFLAIRGEAEVLEEGAIEHLDQLTRRYTDNPRCYGIIYTLEQQAPDTQIICRTNARAITLDAIDRCGAVGRNPARARKTLGMLSLPVATMVELLAKVAPCFHIPRSAIGIPLAFRRSFTLSYR